MFPDNVFLVSDPIQTGKNIFIISELRTKNSPYLPSYHDNMTTPFYQFKPTVEKSSYILLIFDFYAVSKFPFLYISIFYSKCVCICFHFFKKFSTVRNRLDVILNIVRSKVYSTNKFVWIVIMQEIKLYFKNVSRRDISRYVKCCLNVRSCATVD